MTAWQRILGAGGVIGALILGGSAGGSAGAGGIAPTGTISPTSQVDVYIEVYGLEAANADLIVPEIYTDAGAYVQDCSTPVPWGSNPSPLIANYAYSCDLAFGSYTIGASNAPVDYRREASCFAPAEPGAPPERFVDPTVDLEVNPFGSSTCSISFSTSVLFLDKQVNDGPATTNDFTLEVFGEGGEPFATGIDPSADACTNPFAADVLTTCLVLDLPDGEYTLGEVPVYGYQPSVAPCTFSDFDERIDSPSASFTALAGRWGQTIRCTIDNTYFEGRVVLTKTLTNDDGGTAALSDFTLELFDDNGVKVDEGACDNTGLCLDGNLPIGDYVVGETGPSGYARTVTQSVIVPTEQLSDPEASFTLEPFNEVRVNVDSNDIATTTTTTLAPTTTAAPTTTQAITTTLAPTTAGPTTTDLGAGVVTLPATGQSGQSGWVATVALLMLVLGAGAMWASRRSA